MKWIVKKVCHKSGLAMTEHFSSCSTRANNNKQKRKPRLVMLHASYGAVALVYLLGQQSIAHAGCATLDGIHYTCSGVTSATVYISGTQNIVTADSTFQLSGNPDGLRISASGALPSDQNTAISLNQAAGSSILGSHAGIHTWNDGTGTTSITTAGDVSGNDQVSSGIAAINGANTTGMTVTQTAGTVAGGSSGIHIENFGTGTTSITTAGDVSGNYQVSSGIAASNYANTTGMTVTQTAGTVTGSYYGIYTNNRGTGTTSITTAGDVFGYFGFGILADNDENSTDMTVTQTAGTVYGGSSGIHIENFGTGTTSITIASDVTGDGGAGIYAINGANTTGMTVTQTAGTVAGGSSGIHIENFGTGTTSITTAGDVTGRTAAIYLYNAHSTTTYAVNIDGGTVTATSPDYGVIHTLGQGRGTIDIGSLAVVDAGSHDQIAIRDGDLDRDGTDEVGGNVVVTSAGTVTGTAVLGLGNDTFDLVGGSWTGDIYGDDMVASNADGNDTFNWSGGDLHSGFHGINGSDTAVISGAANYDGTQILDGGDDYSTVDGWVDSLTFSNITATAPGANIINWEVLTLDSASLTISDGSLEVGDGNDGTGIFLTHSSTLDGDDNLVLTANLSIDATSTFEATGGGSGVYRIAYNLNNDGTVNMSDGAADDHLTVAGNYTTNSGTIVVDVDFNARTSDHMTVAGTVSGNGIIAVNDITAASYNSHSNTSAGQAEAAAAAAGKEITLIEESSDNDKSDETFILAAANQYNGNTNLGRFVNSPFIWRLKSTGNNWVLGYAFDGSPQIQTTIPTITPKHAVVPEVPAYIGLPTFSNEMVINELDTLHMRLGELRHHRAIAGSPELKGLRSNDPAIEFDEHKLNGWVRGTYSNSNFAPNSNFAMDSEYGSTNLGFDRRFQFGDSVLYGGIFGGLSQGNFDNNGRGATYGSLFAAHTEIKAWSAGLYATWFGCNGYFVDLVGEYMDMNADIKAVDHYSTNGSMVGASIEVGKSVKVTNKAILEPQAQLKLANVQWDGFFDSWNDVNFEDHTYLTGRLGLRGEYTFELKEINTSEIKSWIYVGVQHEFTDASTITYVIDFDSHQYDTTANFQAGVTADVGKLLQFYFDAGATSNFDGYDSFRADFGLRIRW